MDSAVVYKVNPYYLVAICLKQFGDRPTKQIVSYMTKMERFVCIWRGELYHHSLASWRQCAKILRSGDGAEDIAPITEREFDIEKTLYHIERLNLRASLFKPAANLLCRLLRPFVTGLKQRKSYKGNISFKLLPCSLCLNKSLLNLCAIQLLESQLCLRIYK